MLNNRLITYIEEDVQFRVLIPNLLALDKTPLIPNEDPIDIENRDLEKGQKYI